MKIAFLLNQFPVISETFILNQITGLIDLGHEVSIFSAGNPNQKKVHDDIEKYQLMDRIHYLPSIPKNKFLRQMRALGIILPLLFIFPGRIARLLRLTFEKPEMPLLRRLYWFRPLAKTEFDILHCHFGPVGIVGAEMKHIGVRGKLVTSFHGYDVNRISCSQGKILYQRLFEKTELITSNSNFTKKQLLNMGCPNEKIKILPVGLNVDQFRFTKKTCSADEPVRLLTVGRLIEKKGHCYAIAAIAKLIQLGKTIHYRIAGDGPLRQTLEKQIADLGIQDHVDILGEVTQNEAMELYQDSHLFLLPSVTAQDGDREGQGLVLQEAQAAGLPVVATLHNGFPDSILDGTSGYLVPEKNVDALTDKLTYLIENSQAWSEMGRQGRAFVEERFDIEKLNRSLVELYQNPL